MNFKEWFYSKFLAEETVLDLPAQFYTQEGGTWIISSHFLSHPGSNINNLLKYSSNIYNVKDVIISNKDVAVVVFKSIFQIFQKAHEKC